MSDRKFGSESAAEPERNQIIDELKSNTPEQKRTRNLARAYQQDLAGETKKSNGVLYLIIGGLSALFLIIFVQKLALFGRTCYVIGSVDFDKTCFHPIVYFLSWAFSFLFFLAGIVSLAKTRQ